MWMRRRWSTVRDRRGRRKSFLCQRHQRWNQFNHRSCNHLHPIPPLSPTIRLPQLLLRHRLVLALLMGFGVEWGKGCCCVVLVLWTHAIRLNFHLRVCRHSGRTRRIRRMPSESVNSKTAQELWNILLKLKQNVGERGEAGDEKRDNEVFGMRSLKSEALRYFIVK